MLHGKKTTMPVMRDPHVMQVLPDKPGKLKKISNYKNYCSVEILEEICMNALLGLRQASAPARLGHPPV